MISVQNPRQLLSGNKYIWIAIAGLLLFVAACSGSKNSTREVTPETDTNRPKDSGIVGDLPKDTIPFIVPDSLLTDDLFTYKDTYDIALIIPLFLDKFRAPNMPDSLIVPENLNDDPELFKPAMLGLEYYQGVKMALDSLAAQGFSARVHVFDGSDDIKVKVLVNTGKLMNMDLILGPVYNSHVKIVAPFANKNRIPMVSPLSPANNLVNMNDMYIMANPPLETHIETMFSLVADSFNNQNLNLLYLDDQNEYAYVQLLKKLAKQHNQTLVQFQNLMEQPFPVDTNPTEGMVIFEEIPVSRDPETKLPELGDLELELYLDHEKNNVFVMPTVDMAVIQMVTRELFAYSKDYHITIIGTPAWGNDEDLRMDYVDAMHVYFTSPYHIDSSFYSSALRDSFVVAFNTEPSSTTIKAYDLTRYLGTLMKDYGTSYYHMMQVDEYQGWHTSFRFRNQMVMDSVTFEMLTDHVENKFVHILRYKDQQVLKLN